MIVQSPKLTCLRGAITVLPAALLLAGLAIGAVHHHPGEAGSHSCAICALGHAPAAPAAPAPLSAPALHRERVAVMALGEPVTAHLPSPSSRSPPSL